jgi:hypothetical protein
MACMSTFPNGPTDPEADRPSPSSGSVRRDREPDRGRLLQWLAAASLVCIATVVLSPVGLVGCIAGYCMARADLQGMGQGSVDPRRRLRTESAYRHSVTGMIFVGTYIVCIFLGALLLTHPAR